VGGREGGGAIPAVWAARNRARHITPAPSFQCPTDSPRPLLKRSAQADALAVHARGRVGLFGEFELAEAIRLADNRARREGPNRPWRRLDLHIQEAAI
jgi:hypothetical protein